MPITRQRRCPLAHHTPQQWSDFFGVRIVGPDGFINLANESEGELVGDMNTWQLDMSTFLQALLESSFLINNSERWTTRFHFLCS